MLPTPPAVHHLQQTQQQQQPGRRGAMSGSAVEQRSRAEGLATYLNMCRVEVQDGVGWETGSQLLDRLASALIRVNKLDLPPGMYFEVYSAVSDLLMAAECALRTVYSSQSTENDRALEQLYDHVFCVSQLVPRVYLQILVGGVILDATSPQFERLRILRDVSASCRGVQHLVKGVFTRYYLVQTLGRRLSNMRLSESEDTTRYNISIHSAAKCLAVNFEELASTLFDLRILGLSAGAKKSTEWSQLCTLMLSAVLQQLSNLDHLSPSIFISNVWPYVCEPILRSSAIVNALSDEGNEDDNNNINNSSNVGGNQAQGASSGNNEKGGKKLSQNHNSFADSVRAQHMSELYAPSENETLPASDLDASATVIQFQTDILRYVARAFSEDVCIAILPALISILPSLTSCSSIEKVFAEMLLKIERYLIREDMKDIIKTLITDNWESAILTWATEKEPDNIIVQFYLAAFGYIRKLGATVSDININTIITIVSPLTDSSLRVLQYSPELCLKVLSTSCDLLLTEFDKNSIKVATPGSTLEEQLRTFLQLPINALINNAGPYPELLKQNEHLSVLNVFTLPQYIDLAKHMPAKSLAPLAQDSLSCILMPNSSSRVTTLQLLIALEPLLTAAFSYETGNTIIGVSALQLIETRNLTDESEFPQIYDKLYEMIAPHVNESSLKLTASILLSKAAAHTAPDSSLLFELVKRLKDLNMTELKGIHSGVLIATLCRIARIIGARAWNENGNENSPELANLTKEYFKASVEKLGPGMDAAMSTIVSSIFRTPLPIEEQKNLTNALLDYVRTLDFRERILPLSQLLVLPTKRGDVEAVSSMIEESTRNLVREGDANGVLESACTVLMLQSRLSEALTILPKDASEEASSGLAEIIQRLSKTCIEMMNALEDQEGIELMGIPIDHICNLYNVSQKNLDDLRARDPRFASLKRPSVELSDDEDVDDGSV